MSEPTATTNGRVTATATCRWCAWKAQHTGDSVVEVGTFLRARCLAHTEEKHPDRLTAPHALDPIEVKP